MQYTIPNAPGVGGLKTALPKVREGFSPQQIDLGRYLFFDPLLSANGKISCATCHNPKKGFSDCLASSVGMDDYPLKRATPSLWNVAYLKRLFWDGRTSSLEEQMKGPLFSQHEMGNTPEKLLNSLNSTANYRHLFLEAIPKKKKNEPAILLTGGKANERGKTWKISKVYKAGKDGAGGVSDDLDIQILSVDNVLGLFGLSDVYEDRFTFFHDGRYVADNKDGKRMMGVVYALINHAQNIRVVSADTQSLPLADVIYTPKSDATWEIKKGDFEVAAATGNVKFTDKTQLVLTEYLAYKDAGTFVILKKLTDNYMNIALGIHTEPSIIDKPTLLFHMSLTAE